MDNVSGIYKIYCDGNDRSYIGSSVNVRKRKNSHLCELRNNKHPNDYLQNSFNRYGEDSFTFSLILECKPELLLIKEEEQIKIYDTYKDGFNLIETPTKNLLGYKHTDKNKARMSEIAKKRGRNSGSLSEEQVKEMRQKFFDGHRISSLSKHYETHRKTVRECVYLKTYQDVLCEIEGYTEMLEELKEARKKGKRPRSRGWKHSSEFIQRFTKAVSKPRAAHKRALTPEQVRAIRLRASEGETYKVLAAEFDVNQNSISRIVRRLSYKDVDQGD